MEIHIEIKAAGRQKVDIGVRDDAGAVVFTDRANLAGIEGRAKTANNLCAKLRELGVERTPDELERELQGVWAKFVEAQEKEAAERAKSGAAEDPDARERRRLEAMPAEVRAKAEALVRSPNLMKVLVDGVAAHGVAGERESIALLILAGRSRKLARPVAVRVKGPTGSGKSFVLEAVGRSMPPESVLVATQITPQALFHMPPDSLRHKLIIAGERSRGKDDEVAEATRALREMISSGRLSKLMPVKLGGELQTVLIEQEGPIAFAESTTMSKVFAEDENRAIGIFTDERTDQTRLVMAGLARGLSGADVDLAQYACGAALLSHGVQRLLARGDVVIPYAPKLADLLPANRVEIRRAFSQLLSLIQASGLLHQYQRERDDNGRLVAGPDDYKLARHLLREPMRRLVGSGPSDPARRFHKRLVGWFGWGSFTTKEAKLKEEASRASVYEWLGELSGAGAVELLEAGRGRMPARWEMRELGHDAEVLPSAAQLFGTDK